MTDDVETGRIVYRRVPQGRRQRKLKVQLEAAGRTTEVTRADDIKHEIRTTVPKTTFKRP